MMFLLQNIKAGTNVVEICKHGDQMIEELCASRNKKIKPQNKGIAFPTCISRNNCVGHFSPLPEDEPVTLNDGDLVKM